MTLFAELETFVRSFFLQALWNYERMQNVGFAFSLEPLLKRACRTQESFARALRRNFDYFNVHPYFAPIIMGVIYNKEKELADSKRLDDPTITVLKNSMGAAFGAVGDHVIWEHGALFARSWRYAWVFWLDTLPGTVLRHPCFMSPAPSCVRNGGLWAFYRCLIQFTSGCAGEVYRRPFMMDLWSFGGWNLSIFRPGRRKSGE